MKLQLLHIFDDGREVWADPEMDGDVYMRHPSRGWWIASWQGWVCSNEEESAEESAREEALRVDDVKTIGWNVTHMRKGKRVATFYGNHGTADFMRESGTQAQAFRWLFIGRLD